MESPAFLDVIRQALPAATLDERPSVDMPTVSVDAADLREVFTVLRDHPALQFAFLADVTAVDRLPDTPRFELVYHLASLGEAYGVLPVPPPRRLRVKVAVDGTPPRAPSVTAIYPTANWPEREVFDLFGIEFEGHPDLRRILMTDEWEGHPLRKDYPVQIRKTPRHWSPIQLTVEEFAANVRATQEEAARRSRASEEPHD